MKYFKVVHNLEPHQLAIFFFQQNMKIHGKIQHNLAHEFIFEIFLFSKKRLCTFQTFFNFFYFGVFIYWEKKAWTEIFQGCTQPRTIPTYHIFSPKYTT